MEDIAFAHEVLPREQVSGAMDEMGEMSIVGVTGLGNRMSFEGLRRELQVLLTESSAMTKWKGPLIAARVRVAQTAQGLGTARGEGMLALMLLCACLGIAVEMRVRECGSLGGGARAASPARSSFARLPRSWRFGSWQCGPAYSFARGAPARRGERGWRQLAGRQRRRASPHARGAAAAAGQQRRGRRWNHGFGQCEPAQAAARSQLGWARRWRDRRCGRCSFNSRALQCAWARAAVSARRPGGGCPLSQRPPRPWPSGGWNSRARQGAWGAR